MVNWRRDFPVLRVALGVLGQKGYTSLLVGRFLVWRSEFEKLRVYCDEIVQRPLSDEMLQSRLKRPHELQWFRDNDPESYRRGERLARSLEIDLKKGGFHPFGVLGQ